MIEVSSEIKINEDELHFDFIRSAGPGGQNVNKVATAVQLRFNVRESPSLALDVKERLIKLAGNRMTEEGVMIIEAKRTRSQEKNRLDAIQRLVKLIQQAAEPPKPRKKTRPGAGAAAVRMADKRKRGDAKRLRQYNPEEWE
jgi:ribosome-associated protein